MLESEANLSLSPLHRPFPSRFSELVGFLTCFDVNRAGSEMNADQQLIPTKYITESISGPRMYAHLVKRVIDLLIIRLRSFSHSLSLLMTRRMYACVSSTNRLRENVSHSVRSSSKATLLDVVLIIFVYLDEIIRIFKYIYGYTFGHLWFYPCNEKKCN